MSFEISRITSRIARHACRSISIRLLFAAIPVCSVAQNQGDYTLRYDQPHQVIRGLGFEIQSDSIASGNAGMPEEVIAVPHDLTPTEKVRFAKEMLHGFRYARLAM